MVGLDKWKDAFFRFGLKTEGNDRGCSTRNGALRPRLICVSNSKAQRDLIKVHLRVYASWGHITTVSINLSLCSNEISKFPNAQDLAIFDCNVRCWRVDQFGR